MSNAPEEIELDGYTALDASLMGSIYRRRIYVRISPRVWERIQRSCDRVDELLDQDVDYYGINTGIGSLCAKRIRRNELQLLQENLVRSHAVGVGDPVPDELVRWMLLFKIHALLYGHSGVRRKTLETLVRLLNADVLPIVPSRGSLGASGDLAPLAHMALPLIGLGDVRLDGVRMPATEGLHKRGIEPIKLHAKEGLALINGTQLMTAYGAALCVRGMHLAKAADIAAAMSLQAIGGSLAPFDARMHKLRPHRGAVTVAENIRRLASTGRTKSAIPGQHRVQDPYSIRCVAQVHGATRDVLAHVQDIIVTDVNSVTDNPLILDNGDVVNGGNFHGQPIALALDYLACALAELGSISERRQYVLLSGSYGLPEALMKESGVNTGLLIAQYTSAALVSENKILCHPASVDSIPTAGGQEDHVSMGALAALKCWEIVKNVEAVVATEFVIASQALDFIPKRRLGVGVRAAHETVRATIKHSDRDRVFQDDLAFARQLVSSQELVKSVQVRMELMGS